LNNQKIQRTKTSHFKNWKNDKIISITGHHLSCWLKLPR